MTWPQSDAIAFEKAMIESLRRLVGPDSCRVHPRFGKVEIDLTLSLSQLPRRGLVGEVLCEVKNTSRKSSLEAAVNQLMAAATSQQSSPQLLLICRDWLSQATISSLKMQASGHRLVIWDFTALVKFIKEEPDAAEPLKEHIRSPDVEVQVNTKGWTIPASAFVLPIGPGGSLTGATYVHFVGDIGQQIEAQITNKMPKNFSPRTPYAIKMGHGENTRPLVIATAYEQNDEESVVIGVATEAVLRLAARRGFQHITLPLIGAAGIGEPEAIKQIIGAIYGTILPKPLRVTIVVLNPDMEARVRDALGQASTIAPSSPGLNPGPTTAITQAFFVNDSVNASRDNDKLGITAEAGVFARLLAASDAPMPLAVGLFGHWGSGKSFFMELVEKEVELVAKNAKKVQASKNAGESKRPTPYCSNVVHIRFNAWHYVDRDLWASIGLRIFEGLAEHLRAGEDGETEFARKKRELGTVIDSQKREKVQAEEALKAATDQRDRLRSELENALGERKIKAAKISLGSALTKTPKELYTIAKKLGVGRPDKLDALEKEIARAREIAESFRVFLPGCLARQHWFVQFLVLAASGVGLSFGVDLLELVRTKLVAFLKPDVTAAVTSLTLASAWVGDRLALAKKAQEPLSRLLEAVRQSDEVKAAASEIEKADANIAEQQQNIAAAEVQIAEAAERLQQIESGALIYEFLTKRMAHTDYVGSMGVVSVLRRDLEHLQRSVFELREHKETAGEKLAEKDLEQEIEQAVKAGEIPQRIILYIDDLDRCEPKRVVEVLQAVHLLLAFKLFAVVVAVDPRWLERALYERYIPDHRRMNEDELAADEFSPQNYLEKIFQVPFRVPAMEPKAFETLVRALAPQEEPARFDLSLSAGDPTGMIEAPDDEAESDDGADEVDEDLAAPPQQEMPPLLLADHETMALSSVGTFIRTPRATKRLVNVYTLIRNLSAETDPALHRKLMDADDIAARALALLLAIDIGFPHATQLVRPALEDGHEDLPALVVALKASAPSLKVLRVQLDCLEKALEGLEGALLPTPTDLDLWRRYADLFSFHEPTATEPSASDAKGKPCPLGLVVANTNY